MKDADHKALARIVGGFGIDEKGRLCKRNPRAMATLVAFVDKVCLAAEEDVVRKYAASGGYQPLPGNGSAPKPPPRYPDGTPKRPWWHRLLP